MDVRLVRSVVREALREDVGEGDITTFFCISPRRKTKAVIFVKQPGVLCGIEVAREVFRVVDAQLKFRILKKDGHTMKKGDHIAYVSGRAGSILTAERVALNFLSLLSGVSSYTRQFVNQLKGTKAKIMDTRKTTPTLRALEKYAVRVGGGHNHRFGLWDAILIKDNHLRVSDIIKKKKFDEENFAKIVTMIRKNTKYKIEVEVENLNEYKKIIRHYPDIILLDNFTLANLRKAVVMRDASYPAVFLEASGGVTLHNARRIAQTGVDFISSGSITHSPQSTDFSLEIDE
ncbi:MAG: carboxylating nicotinate-nucleotide diphosphorylase [Candidatus Omnitrophica bacterium]|nr:carboxylating nicotinate-nucleotide diphosphorylase [Candidatus Omnitrophota bacterium]